MDIDELRPLLPSAIPDELYCLKPGDVAYFVPIEGINIWTTHLILDVLVYFRKLYRDNNVRVRILPTDNVLLIGTLAGRSIHETGSPYQVVVSTRDTIAGLASQYFGEDVQSIVERVPIAGASSLLSVSTKEPLVVSLYTENCPEKEMCSTCPFIDRGDGSSYARVLQAKPEPGTKEEKELIKKQEDKLYSVLRECYVLDIEPDIDKTRKKLENAINDTTDYNLTIKVERNQAHHGNGEFSVFDIYVADGEKYKLDFTAAEKAVYLTFLLYGQRGIRVAETFWDFRETSQKIYIQMPFEERCDTTAAGMMSSQNAPLDYEVYLKTLRGYLSTIRTKVARKVLQPKTAIEFAIEGYKDEAFCIKRSTREIQKQLKKDLHL